MTTKHLVSQDNPNGKRTEEILSEIRAEILVRMASYGDDPRPEAKAVIMSLRRIVRGPSDVLGQLLGVGLG